MRRTILIGLSLLLYIGLGVTMFLTGGESGDYPSKPITIVVHSDPGSGVDVMSRKVAMLAEKHGVKMVVENKKGTQGVVAMEYVLGKKRDGYTLMAVTKSFQSTLILMGSRVGMDDFTYLATLFEDPEVLIVNKASGIDSLADLIGEAGRNPGAQVWLGPEVGGRDHLMSIKCWETFGIDALYRGYKGGPEAILALLRNEGSVYVGNAEDLRGREDDLKILAVASPQRIPRYPDVETFDEQGFHMDEYMWRGFAFAKGVPRHAQVYIENLLSEIAAEEEWKDYVRDDLAAIPSFMGRKAFQTRVSDEDEETRAYLLKAGLLREYLEPGGLFDVIAPLGIVLMALVIVLRLIRANRLPDLPSTWVYGVSVALAAVFIYETTQFLVPTDADITSPALVPRIWSVLLALGSLILLIKGESAPSEPIPALNSHSIHLVLLFSGFVALSWLIGYYISAFVFIVIATGRLRFGTFGSRLTAASLFCACGYLIFHHAFKIEWPQGWIWSQLLG